MTNTTFIQSDVSVSPAIANPSFSSMSKRAGEFVAASASAKQKPVHYTAIIARKLNDKSADMDCHAVPAPDCKAGGDSMREELCRQDLQQLIHHSGDWSSSKLRATGSHERSANAGEGKVPQANTDGEQYIRRFDDPATSFQPQNLEEQEFCAMVLHSICAECGKEPAELCDFPSNLAIWSQFTSDCLWASFWAKQGSRRVQTSGHEQKFPQKHRFK